MIQRKRKTETPVNHERWLISYADFITLLFAVFVVLYASSKTDAEKLKKVAESIENAFAKKGTTDNKTENGLGIEGPSFPVLEKSKENDSVDLQTPPIEQVPLDLDSPMDLKELMSQLDQILKKEIGAADYKDKIELTKDKRGVIIRFSAEHFFDSGSAEVRHDERLLLKQIGKTIKKANRYLRIEGHTDNGKVSSDLYPSNWELSTARASWVTRFYIKEFGVDPRQIEAAGLAENHPIASNEDDIGRAKNRRVEIIILQNPPYPELKNKISSPEETKSKIIN